MPTKAQLEQWIPGALDNFKSVIRQSMSLIRPFIS